MGVGRRSVVTATYILISRLIALVANIAVVLLVTRYLGKEGFGHYAFVMGYSLIIGTLATGGTYAILIRETARDRARAGENLGSALHVQAAFTLVATALGMLALNLFTRDPAIRNAAYVSIIASDVQVLANLLWAGFGVNRPQTGGRTAPSAYDFQDVDIYLATAKGLFHYDAGNQCLKAILSDDVRPFTGVQAFVATVPVNLVYVSDYSRMASASVEDREHWSWAHSGFIAQNVYLACASEGLANVVRSTINRAQLANRMGLNENQHIILAQSIGYPAA